ncbi:MAG TPA: hypothetical protein PKK37_02860 [Candidatus Pacearchaeota archaeon]|nr:hypothetical protein [Candidatus Pacearchaeota archaeon]
MERGERNYMVMDAIFMDAIVVSAMPRAMIFIIAVISVPLTQELRKVALTAKSALQVRFAIPQSAVLRVMAVMAADHLPNSVTLSGRSGKIFGRNTHGTVRIGRCLMPGAGDVMRMALAQRELLANLLTRSQNGTA